MDTILNNLNWINAISGYVWIILTFNMLIILYRIFKAAGTNNKHFYLGMILLLFTWMHPLYTDFYTNLEIALLGNVFIIFLSTIYTIRLKVVDLTAAKMMLPQLIWLICTNVYSLLKTIDKYQ